MKHVNLYHACYLLLLIVGVGLTCPADLVGQVPVEIPNSLLKIIRSVSVPAETEGVIVELNVATGDVVSRRQVGWYQTGCRDACHEGGRIRVPSRQSQSGKQY